MIFKCVALNDQSFKQQFPDVQIIFLGGNYDNLAVSFNNINLYRNLTNGVQLLDIFSYSLIDRIWL